MFKKSSLFVVSACRSEHLKRLNFTQNKSNVVDKNEPRSTSCGSFGEEGEIIALIKLVPGKV